MSTATVVLTADVLKMLTTRLHGLPYPKARQKIEELRDQYGEENRAALDQILASHGGNPDNRPAPTEPTSQAEPEEPVVQLTPEELKAKRAEGIAAKMVAGEIDAEELNRQFAALSRGQSAGTGKPYTLKNGSVVPKNPHPKCLLLRDVTSANKPRKVPTIMFFVLKGKEVKGRGFSGNIMLAEPVLRSLVTQHGCNGTSVLAEALRAYDDGTIAVAREKDDE